LFLSQGLITNIRQVQTPNFISSILLKTCLKPGVQPSFEQICDKVQPSQSQVSDLSLLRTCL